MICDPTLAEIERLREQTRRLKAAIARVRKCRRFDIGNNGFIHEDSSGHILDRLTVMAALRLRK